MRKDFEVKIKYVKEEKRQAITSHAVERNKLESKCAEAEAVSKAQQDHIHKLESKIKKAAEESLYLQDELIELKKVKGDLAKARKMCTSWKKCIKHKELIMKEKLLITKKRYRNLQKKTCAPLKKVYAGDTICTTKSKVYLCMSLYELLILFMNEI